MAESENRNESHPPEVYKDPEGHVTPHTRRVRREQTLAKGIIWFAAGLTMTILLLIVGYIIVNGLYTRQELTQEVLPYESREIRYGREGDDTFAIKVSRNLRISTLNYTELKKIYGGENSFWGYLSGQNLRIQKYLVNNPGLISGVAGYLLISEETLREEVTLVDPGQAAELLKGEPNAIVLLPSAMLDQISRGKQLSLRELTMVAHPDVFQLQAGRRLNSISHNEGDIAGMLGGEIQAWNEVGGPSVEIRPADLQNEDPGEYDPLPVQLVGFSPDAASQHELVSAGISAMMPGDDPSADFLYRADSAERFAELIRTTPGSAGLVRQREALKYGLDQVSVQRIEHQRNLRLSFFFEAPSRAGAVGGVSYIILNTLAMVAFVLLIATPIGVGAAIYLVEYAQQGPWLKILRIGTDTLAGIPSIIFGLFGLVFFSQFLGFKTGLVSGTLTLTLMILHTIVRTSEEAIKSVSDELRHGSLAVGATKYQTIMRVVLPSAAPGILTGVILGIGRAVGETAAILFTMGSNMALMRSLNSPIRVLSVHLYMLIRENISIPNAFATATILVVIEMFVIFATHRLIRKTPVSS